MTASTAGSATDWCEEMVPHFAGKQVVVLFDNDEPGRKDALRKALALLPVTESVRVVELPGLRSKGDVTDWKEDGHTLAELRDLVEKSPALSEERLTELERQWFPIISVVEEAESEPEPPEDLATMKVPSGAWTGFAQQYLDIVGQATEAPESFHLGALITAVGCLVGRRAPSRAWPQLCSIGTRASLTGSWPSRTSSDLW